MEHAKLKTCKHCGGPLEPRPISGGEYCPTCEATSDPKDATSMEHKNKIAAFIHEELIVAGGGDMTYAEMIQLSRRASRLLLKAIFWGGVAALAFFVVDIFVPLTPPTEDFTFLRFMAITWPICTFIYLLTGGGRYGGGGNGGGGNGGG